MEMVGLGAEEVTSLLSHSGVSSPGCVHAIHFVFIAWKQYAVVFLFSKQRRKILIPGYDLVVP